MALTSLTWAPEGDGPNCRADKSSLEGRQGAAGNSALKLLPKGPCTASSLHTHRTYPLTFFYAQKPLQWGCFWSFALKLSPKLPNILYPTWFFPMVLITWGPEILAHACIAGYRIVSDTWQVSTSWINEWKMTLFNFISCTSCWTQGLEIAR
jgi:hypothetical protein